MNRSEKIEYVKKALSGEIHPVKDTTNWFWFDKDGIHLQKYPGRKTRPITEDEFNQLNGDTDFIMVLDDVDINAYSVKGSIKIFIS